MPHFRGGASSRILSFSSCLQAKYISHCIDEIKQELKQDNIAVKANAVCKLTYVSTPPLAKGLRPLSAVGLWVIANCPRQREDVGRGCSTEMLALSPVLPGRTQWLACVVLTWFYPLGQN